MERQFNSLDAIAERKKEIERELEANEAEIRKIWNELFHKEEKKPLTPTQRILSFANTGAGVLDGLILGWKLYKKFKKK